MKKTLLLALAMTMVLCLLVLIACGMPDDMGINEKRTVEFSQLYNEKNGQFSLDGYAPGMTQVQLQETDGFLREEPIVFHGLAAKVSYSFTDGRLFRVTFDISAEKMSQSQWDAAASNLFDGLQREFDPVGGLEAYQRGTLASRSGMVCLWYAKGAGGDGSNGMSMLAFSATPPSTDEIAENSIKPNLTIAITADLPANLADNLPESRLATASYRSHFPPADDEMVNVAEFVPGIVVDLMYARSDNFTGQIIYDFHNAYLRYGTVKKLMDVQKKLHRQGYSLKICDAFRPVAAQFKLWEIVPDPNFVADPYHGYSTHSRGNTVDLDLVTVDGNPVEMPTPVDTFSPLADRDYSDVNAAAAAHALLLQNAMVEAGFKTSSVEWWHYYDTVSYPVAKDFKPEK